MALTHVFKFIFLTLATNPFIVSKLQCKRSHTHYQDACPANFDMCENCQEFITMLQIELSDPQVQESIIQFFEYICQNQQYPLDEVCLEMVHQTVPEAIKEFVNADPFDICRELMLC